MLILVNQHSNSDDFKKLAYNSGTYFKKLILQYDFKLLNTIRNSKVELHTLFTFSKLSLFPFYVVISEF